MPHPLTLPPSQIIMILLSCQNLAMGGAGAQYCNHLAYKFIAKDSFNDFRWFLSVVGSMPKPTRDHIDRIALKLFTTPQEFDELPRVRNSTAWGCYMDCGLRYVVAGDYYEVVFYVGESVTILLRIESHISTGKKHSSDLANGTLLEKAISAHQQALCEGLQVPGESILLFRKFTPLVEIVPEKGDEELLFRDDEFFAVGKKQGIARGWEVVAIDAYAIRMEKEGKNPVKELDKKIARLFLRVRFRTQKWSESNGWKTPAQLSAYPALVTAFLSTLPPSTHTLLSRFLQPTPTGFIDLGRYALTSLEKTSMTQTLEGVLLGTTSHELNSELAKLEGLWFKGTFPGNVRCTNERKGWLSGESKNVPAVVPTKAEKAHYLAQKAKYIDAVKEHGMVIDRETWGEESLRKYRTEAAEQKRLLDTYQSSTQLIVPHFNYDQPILDQDSALTLPWQLLDHLPTTRNGITTECTRAFKAGWWVDVQEGGVVEIAKGVVLDLPAELLGFRKLEVGERICVWLEPRYLIQKTGLLHPKTCLIRSQVGIDLPTNPSHDIQPILTYRNTSALLESRTHLTAYHSRMTLINYANDLIRQYRSICSGHVPELVEFPWTATPDGAGYVLGRVERLIVLEEIMEMAREVEEEKRVRVGKVMEVIEKREESIAGSPNIHLIPSLPYLLPKPTDSPTLRTSILLTNTLFNGLTMERTSAKRHLILSSKLPLNLGPSPNQALFIRFDNYLHPLIVLIAANNPSMSSRWTGDLKLAKVMLGQAVDLMLSGKATGIDGAIGKGYFQVALYAELDARIGMLGKIVNDKEGRLRLGQSIVVQYSRRAAGDEAMERVLNRIRLTGMA